MTDITELAQRMKAAAEKATPGEWWADEVKNEGCYGSGDDCVEGFTSYAIYGSDGQTLFDSLNSDAVCICEEYDGEGHVAWDETAQRNAEFIALANPANILALVEALEYYKSREERVTSLVRDNSKSWDELYRQVEAKGKRNVELVEALESEKRICATWRKTAEANSEKLEKAQQQMTESENRVRKQNRHICELFDDNTALRQRIAGLESRTVTFKLPSTPEPSAFAPWLAKAFYQFHKDTVKSCVAVFSDACRAAGIKVEAE
ncbi:ead/Ea22-like family protein [Klebsiella pneumoniae]|uniref:ead/Ea22-like family protein n=1 Tax=Klebsiella pneumoniae TaxID=573 RepID=UPI001299F8F1|nr:ead/Ea22-like family protein [Klebsiella pneumoniae]MRE21203.1 ead/Ea22-like family protein [Klebsiella pneumoniae]